MLDLNTIGIRSSEQPDVERDQFIRDKFMSDQFLDFIKKNGRDYERMITYYRCAIMEVETKFRVLNEEFRLQYDHNPIEAIKTRIKSTDSLMKKINRRKIPLSIESIEENIQDIAGVRVICSFPEDIYMLADFLIQQDDITLILKKDYVKHPKPNGYRSLHLIVGIPIFLQNEKRNMVVEVQIRTIAMDFWASLEHKMKYKKDVPDEFVQQVYDELADCAKMSNQLDLRMQAIRDLLEPRGKE